MVKHQPIDTKAALAHYGEMAQQAARHRTLTEIMNEGRRFPLSDEAAERQFMMLDRIARAKFHGPVCGPVDQRHPMDRVFARMVSSGQPFVVIEEGEGDE